MQVSENKDVYERGGEGNSPKLQRTFSHRPDGGRRRCGQHALLLRPAHGRTWHLPTRSDDGAAGCYRCENVYAAWGDARNWNLHAVGVASGEAGWGYPFTADPDNLGVTLSRSGILLGYAYPSQLRAVQAKDGRPLWTVHARAQVALAPIDEQRQQVYAVLNDESLAAVTMATGTAALALQLGGRAECRRA